MDYSFWYGDQTDLKANVVVVEAKAFGCWGGHQLIAYMGMLLPDSFLGSN